MGTVAFYAGTVYTPLDEIREGVVWVDNGVVVKVGTRRRVRTPRGAKVVDLGGRTLAPGFVDLHTHGAAGTDAMQGSETDLIRLGQFYAAHGATSYLATTMTADLPTTLAAARRLSSWVARGRRAWPAHLGARPLGIHLEGPFLNEHRCGAQPKEHIRKPSPEDLALMLHATGRAARLLTLAPEAYGGLDLLRFAKRRGVRVSIGHSDATAEEAASAIRAGASSVTHLFNAMRPFSHRDPGLIGAVLTDDRVSAELIVDGVHVLPEALRLAARAKGLDRIIFVTDSISATGMPDGQYFLGTTRVEVSDRICRTLEGHLAGSTLTLDAALRNWTRLTGAAPAESLRCLTLNPAKVLGLAQEIGVITPGARADFAVLDRSWHVQQTFVGGIKATADITPESVRENR
jgi:N-acetylglucosamine-6-phosphate deacetylase